MRSHPVEQAGDEELEEEATWIYNQAFNAQPVSYQVSARRERCYNVFIIMQRDPSIRES